MTLEWLWSAFRAVSRRIERQDVDPLALVQAPDACRAVEESGEHEGTIGRVAGAIHQVPWPNCDPYRALGLKVA